MTNVAPPPPQAEVPVRSYDPKRARSVTGWYTRGGSIGSGSWGDVSLWIDNAVRRPVAIKRLRPCDTSAYDSEQERRQARTDTRRAHEVEVGVMASLGDHPNVVRLIEVARMLGDHGGEDLYIVMDCMQHDLEGLMGAARRNDRLRWVRPVLKGYAVQMFRGVAYLHANRVLHRDLKPSNVLVSADGVVKVGDFGLACRDDPLAWGRWNPVVVSAWYRAPELLLGDTRYAGPPVDVWSLGESALTHTRPLTRALGCILAEMLFGGMPLFAGRNVDGAEEHGTCRQQLNLIWDVAGTPPETGWPEAELLPWWEVRGCPGAPPKARDFQRTFVQDNRNLARREWFTPAAVALLDGLLTLNPAARLSAAQAAQHPYFAAEHPEPYPPALLPRHAMSYFAGKRNAK